MHPLFRRPLRITGISLAVTLLVGVALVTKIHRERISERKKLARVERLGSGLAMMNFLVIAPFWFFAAAKVGKERRAARAAAQKLSKHSGTSKG